MTAILEREIKLRFDDAAKARAAVVKTGAAPLMARRLQEDYVLDTPDGTLRQRRSVLRVRMETGRAFLTFKGPVHPSPMKLRDELETTVSDGPLLVRLLGALGFQVGFRYEKYREEFILNDVIVAVDETPVGTFIEIEGSAEGIRAMATALGRSSGDFLLDSYRTLFVRHCEQRGLPVTNMLFGDE